MRGFEAMTPIHRVVSKSMLADLEKATKLLPSEWHGKCFQMACAMVKHEIAAGTPVYGHWTGTVDPTGYWKHTAHLPFHQHGWILVPDKAGTIIDPTRFSFENAEPYIYIGPNLSQDGTAQAQGPPPMTFVDLETFNGVTLLDINAIMSPTFCPPGYDPLPAGASQRWFVRKRDKLKVCMSAAREVDSRAWLHVSFSFKNRTPSYQDMAHVKAVFVGGALPAYMVLPRVEDHYNLHKHCLHLFAPLQGADPLPDFLAGVGGI